MQQFSNTLKWKIKLPSLSQIPACSWRQLYWFFILMCKSWLSTRTLYPKVWLFRNIQHLKNLFHLHMRSYFLKCHIIVWKIRHSLCPSGLFESKFVVKPYEIDHESWIFKMCPSWRSPWARPPLGIPSLGRPPGHMLYIGEAFMMSISFNNSMMYSGTSNTCVLVLSNLYQLCKF